MPMGSPGLLAIAVAPVVDHLDRLLDLLQELALAVAGAQLERVLLFERRPVGRVGRDFVFAQVLAGVVGVLQELVAQLDQALSEEAELRFVHVVLLGRLEQVLLGEDLDLLGRRRACDCLLRCHAGLCALIVPPRTKYASSCPVADCSPRRHRRALPSASNRAIISRPRRASPAPHSGPRAGRAHAGPRIV